MNTNELVTIGEHLQSLNDDNLAQRVFDGTEVQNFIGGTLEHLSNTRIRETETEPPTREDADRNGQIFAYNRLGDAWQVTGILNVTKNKYYKRGVESDLYPFWLPMPQLHEVTP